jgi:aspartate/methionine/tyrosine aminotransferase
VNNSITKMVRPLRRVSTGLVSSTRLASTLARPTPLRTFRVERYAGWTDGSDSLSSSETEPLALSELLALADEEGAEMWRSLSLGYSSHNEGSPFLRREILATQYSDTLHDVALVNVLAPQEGIYLACRALLSPGDHVVATAPLYQSLGEVARSIGCDVSLWRPDVLGNSGGGGVPRFDPKSLASLLQPGRTKLVMANWPHNPTGALPTAEEFTQVARLCEQTSCHLVVDEMYRHLEHAGPSATLPAACEITGWGVSLSGLSKTVGLPGLRIGWLASRDEALMARVAQLKDYTTICPAAPSEVLGLIALRAQETLLARSRSFVSRGLASARQLAQSMPEHIEWLEPSAGTFAFVRLPGLRASGATSTDSEDYCEALRRRANLMLMPGSLFELDESRRARAAREGGEPGTMDSAQRVRITYGRAGTPALLERWAEDLRQCGV